MPDLEIIPANAKAFCVNGEQVMMTVTSYGRAFMFTISNVDDLSDSLMAALISRDLYRKHIKHAMELEQLMGRGGR